MANRFDFFNIKELKGIIKTDHGFLKVPIRATRVGIFNYIQKDGSIRKELRPKEEVFKIDSMKTLAGVPMTVTHPEEMVSVKNHGKLSVGLTGDQVIKVDEKFLDVPGTITDEKVINSIESKALKGESQEVSCGYTCDMDLTPGVYEGEHYDAVQRNIRYNHVALVDRGRAGPQVKIRLDEDDAVLDNGHIKIDKEKSMKKITIDGKEFEVKADVAEAFEALVKSQGEKETTLQAKSDELEKNVKEIKKSLDETEAKKDSLEAEVKAAKDEVEKAKKETKVDHNEIDKLVNERANVCETAQKVIKDFKKDGKSNLVIKKEVISHLSPELKLDEKSEDYVNARFDAIAEKTELYKDHLKAALEKKADEDNKNINNDKKDSAAVRLASMKKDSEAWKSKLS